MVETNALFLGHIEDCKKFIRKTNDYYVYILRRPDGQPFYVGKGINDRVFSHENEARHPNSPKSNIYKLNVIRSIWKTVRQIKYEIDFLTQNEDAAYSREAELIAKFKRLHEGGPLTNLAAGGGSTGSPAPISLEKHSATLGGIPDDNPERATLNRFVLAIASMGSVVVKPVGQFHPRPTQRYPSKSMSPTLRQAVALAASATANGVSINGQCVIPRKMGFEGVDGLVENGVSCDILTSGLATVIGAPEAEDERFSLSASQSRTVAGLIGYKKCINLGILSDDELKIT